jgi:hypothetical protein
MSIFQRPDDLARDLGQWIRKRADVSRDTMALIEAQSAREIRQLRIVRQLCFIVFVLPAVVWLVSTLALALLS